MELGSGKASNVWSHLKLEEAKKSPLLWPQEEHGSRKSSQEVAAVIQVSDGGGHD